VTAFGANGAAGYANSAGLFHIVPAPTGVGPGLPVDLLHLNVFPNPLNPSTTIEYSIPMGGRVTLRVYDAAGHLVRTLLDAVQPEGARRITWDGRDDAGAGIASGVYLLRLEAAGQQHTRKLVLLK
jgi:hypothetical protein